MSWLEKNYEKAALGGAAVIALGFAFMGYSKLGKVEEDFNVSLANRGKEETSVPNSDLIPKAIQSLQADRTWNKAVAGERPVDLFTGIPLFVSRDDPNKQIDLPNADPVHPPIPNTWWIENRLDPGYADSAARDPDGDGFSNLEEFNAKTDPNDPKSVPSLITKLKYVKDESLGWVIRPSYGSDGKYPLRYRDTQNAQNNTGAANPVGAGELFFAKGAMANRFKLLGDEVRQEENPNTRAVSDVTYLKIEDQRPNKKGTVYEFPAPMSENRMNEHLKFDRTAIFSLEALGLEGKEFKVEENTAFSVPPENDKKDFFLKSVTPQSVTVEYTTPTGEKKTVDIATGAMPQINE